VIVLSIIRDCLDALLHPSARYDALTRARHRAFMAPRLLGSLVAFAAFPLYLAMRGAPTALEVAAFAWLIAPILLSWFLSRTGRYDGAHMLSSLALAGLVMMVAAGTGGIESFATVWLIVIPLEAALSASRRLVAFAFALAMSCAALLIVLGHYHMLPVPELSATLRSALTGFGIVSAILYAAGLAFGYLTYRDYVVACQYGNAMGAQRCNGPGTDLNVYLSREETDRQIRATYGQRGRQEAP